MMLAHHEAWLAVQVVGPVGLSGWAALIGARWYAIKCRARPDPGGPAPVGTVPAGSDTR